MKELIKKAKADAKLKKGEIFTVHGSQISSLEIGGTKYERVDFWRAVTATQAVALVQLKGRLEVFVQLSPRKYINVNEYKPASRHIEHTTENGLVRISLENQQKCVDYIKRCKGSQKGDLKSKSRRPSQTNSGPKRQKIDAAENDKADRMPTSPVDQKNVIGNVIAVYGDTKGKAEVWYYILEKDFEGILLERLDETTFESTATIDKIEQTTVLEWDVACIIRSGGTVSISVPEQQSHQVLLEESLKKIDGDKVRHGSTDSMSIDRHEPAIGQQEITAQ